MGGSGEGTFGFPHRTDDGRPPWLTGDGSYIYYNPTMSMPVYIDHSNGLTGTTLGPSWWDLTPEERRHALYFAAGRALTLDGLGDGQIDLNGYTDEQDVAAEAYALLADGDGHWLEIEYPGLAELVRREAAAAGLPIDDGPIADPDPDDSRFSYGKEPLLPLEPDANDGLSWEEHSKQRKAYEDEIIAMVSRGDIPWRTARP
jgi:hypothetical protein